MQTIGLIGLGNAGRPVAERILSKGYGLNVFDIDGAAVDAAVRRGANGANSAADAVGDTTVTLLPSSVELRQVVFGESGVFKSLRPGMTLIDLSGTDPDCARELQQRLAEKQVTFIGGTIHASGAPAVVIPQGRFSIVVGGEKAKLGPAVGFLNDVADTIICLPEPWMPKAFKIAIILYATTNNIITAEICSYNNDGGALSNSYKDFRQALDMAAKLEIPMPLASMANQIQEMGRATGLQRFNSPAAMGKLYELITGTDLSQATFNAEKRFPESREPRVVYLGE